MNALTVRTALSPVVSETARVRPFVFTDTGIQRGQSTTRRDALTRGDVRGPKVHAAAKSTRVPGRRARFQLKIVDTAGRQPSRAGRVR